MAQRKQLSWNELRVGLFVLAGIGLIVAAVFYVTAGQGPLSPKYTLVTYLHEVSGLSPGAPVRLDGIDVGSVDAITINPAIGTKPEDLKRSIIVTLRINRKYQNHIRTDSQAKPETEGLLGNRYLNISRGVSGLVLQPGNEIPGAEERGINQLVAQGTELEAHMNELIDNIQGMVADVRGGKGTIGKLITDDTAYKHFQSVTARLDDAIANIQAGQGTIGKLYASDVLYTSFNAAIGRADNVIEAIQQQKGALGKFIYDPTLHDSATRFLDRGNNLLDDIHSGKGTLGKLANDDSLFAAWKDAGKNLSNATAKLNSTDSTAGKMFSDPKLYDNLVGLTGDMRLMINDFRKNPKQYLRVKFSIF
jgi:phospholipid/cholesterol/gamma-HCH transport system substrate-binding protein